MSQGRTYNKLGKHKTAAYYFSKAQELNPESETPLIEKSNAEFLRGEYSTAMDDALAALGIKKENLHASYMRSKALFMKGEIEEALMHFHRGLDLRKQPPIFEEGILGARETDEICIGRHAGPILLEFKDVIKKLEKKRMQAQIESLKVYSQRSKDKPKDAPTEELPTTTDWGTKKKLKTIRSRKYLGRLAEDLFFLENLKKDPRLITSHKEHSQKLIDLTKEALHMITETQEILRVQVPLYAMKRMEATTAENIKERRKLDLKRKIEETKNEAAEMIDTLKRARDTKSIKKYLTTAVRTKDFLDKTPVRLLPNKDIFLDHLYNITGQVYLEQFVIQPFMDEDEAIVQVEDYYGIEREEPASLAARRMSQMLIQHRQILDKFKADLKIARKPLEKTWVYYEIAKASLELGFKAELIRNATKKCVREARTTNNLPWIISALILASKLEMKSNNKIEAKTLLKDASEFAGKMDNPRLKEFLDVATKVVEMRSTEGPADLIKVRQKHILEIMADSSLRVAAEQLFNYMDNMPVNRRMSIVPGVKQSQMSTKRRFSKISHKSLSPVTSSQKVRTVVFQTSDA
ncbi:hypothetical protein L9F63_010330 [Diploptera punctata]|uniref:Uncharacterized protein n=1 Tax=Diploptera punctata TaxID=6984 RepID=A0AAD8AHB3_DIPPU|nr:hypothetical protein L9F63_010330 [Diploptera punctata]